MSGLRALKMGNTFHGADDDNIYTDSKFQDVFHCRTIRHIVMMMMMMMMPCVVQKEHVVWAPGVLFGTCNLLILIVIRLLPDSMGRELPQTLRDLEAWYEEPEPEKSGVKAKGIAEMHRMN